VSLRKSSAFGSSAAGIICSEFSAPPVLVRRASSIGAGEGPTQHDLVRIGPRIGPMNWGTLLAGTNGFLY